MGQYQLNAISALTTLLKANEMPTRIHLSHQTMLQSVVASSIEPWSPLYCQNLLPVILKLPIHSQSLLLVRLLHHDSSHPRRFPDILQFSATGPGKPGATVLVGTSWRSSKLSLSRLGQSPVTLKSVGRGVRASLKVPLVVVPKSIPTVISPTISRNAPPNLCSLDFSQSKQTGCAASIPPQFRKTAYWSYANLE